MSDIIRCFVILGISFIACLLKNTGYRFLLAFLLVCPPQPPRTNHPWLHHHHLSPSFPTHPLTPPIPAHPPQPLAPSTSHRQLGSTGRPRKASGSLCHPRQPAGCAAARVLALPEIVLAHLPRRLPLLVQSGRYSSSRRRRSAILGTAAGAERTAAHRGSVSPILVATVVLLPPEELFDAAFRVPQHCHVDDRLLACAVSSCCCCRHRRQRQRRGCFDEVLPERGGDLLVDGGHADEALAGERARGLGEPAQGVELVEGEGAVDFDVGCVVGPVVGDELSDELFGVPDGEGLLVWGWEVQRWGGGGGGGAVGCGGCEGCQGWRV